MSQGMGGRKEEGSRELTSIGHGGARQLRGQREVLFMPTGVLASCTLGPDGDKDDKAGSPCKRVTCKQVCRDRALHQAGDFQLPVLEQVPSCFASFLCFITDAKLRLG